LNSATGPIIIIAASCMCEGGRIAHHLKHGLKDANNTVLFVGWQAPHTLGRRIVEKRRDVRIFGRDVRVRAKIESLRAYSAHADLLGLVNFLEPAVERRSKIFLVHGDEDTAIEFKDTLQLEGHRSVTIPKQFETYELTSRA
jgi:metallo-beta-lactamase family protein